MTLLSSAADLRPVEQTILGPPDGDCFRACVATVLGLDPDDLPNNHGSDWWERWLAWGEARGLAFDWYEDAADVPEGAIWLAAPNSPRIPDVTHAVVALGDEILWDPYPGVGTASTCDLSTTDGAIVVREAS